jgi:DNA-directed RNA polymerase specialized sigma24 family protein
MKSREVDFESDSNSDATQSAPRRKWSLTKEAFDLLLASIGETEEEAGKKYLEIRGNLTRFFEWRGCPFPEDHADETINRVAKRLAEGEEIRNPAGYCIGVARMLLLEISKERAREHLAIGELSTDRPREPDDADSEMRIDCLRSCLHKQSPDNRELIIEYYQGEKGKKIENRKKLTDRFGVPINTLRMRALRVRERLQACVEECLGN